MQQLGSFWRRRDLAHIWHPCTQMHDHEAGNIPLLPIRRARGVWLEDCDGRRYLDAISSWWVNLFGHGRAEIAAAIARQANELEHVIFAGFTHRPAIELAERLTALAPPGLERVFFADNGSAAVEVALKLSFHYWYNQGRPERTRFVALGGGYHGETLGALGVGDLGLYRAVYRPLLIEPLVVNPPDCRGLPPAEWEAASRNAFAAMAETLRRHHETVAAVIVEPLVQCAGGMRMYHPVYLRLLRGECDRYGIHLIADEIATGFGRTGTLFACEQAAISPDLMCLSKGLTGGFLPLAAVLMKEELYQAFYGEYQQGRNFLHSHSYTGNPLACAAALATLDLFEKDDVLAANRRTAALMAENAMLLAGHPHIADVRQTGMIVAFDMIAERDTRTPYPAAERRGLGVYRYGLEHGVLLRPLGDTIYCMPPYVITPDEVERMIDVVRRGIDAVTTGR